EPRPASMCRSRQLYATLSCPPTNHFANGGLDQSSTWSHSLAQVSRRACFSQKASRSARASSYALATTLAAAANSAGGGNCLVSLSRFSRVSLIGGCSSMWSSLRLQVSCGGRELRGFFTDTRSL